MIQRGSHFRTVITVLAVTYLLHVNAATDNEKVIQEIDKLENLAKTMQTPPEMIDAVFKQIEAHCERNRSIDKSYLTKSQKCVEQQINMTQVADDMRAAVPEGKMDNVFRDMCVKYPKVKSCFKDFFEIVDDCWKSGDKISTFVDEVVRFYCGDDNGGERIALFFAEGGLECVQTHGDEVKKCVEDEQERLGLNEEISLNSPDDLNDLVNEKFKNLPKTDEVCKYIDQMYECASVGLRKCKDPTPENLMTSMLKQVGKALECKVKEISAPSLSTSGSSNSMITESVVVGAALVSLFAF